MLWVVEASQELTLSARVVHNGRPGKVAYAGTVHFEAGTWVGVELDGPWGRHDGTVDGTRYFSTASNRGVFVRPSALTRVRPLTPEFIAAERERIILDNSLEIYDEELEGAEGEGDGVGGAPDAAAFLDAEMEEVQLRREAEVLRRQIAAYMRANMGSLVGVVTD